MTFDRRLFHGILAGAAGTTAEAAWSRVEHHLLGGRPPVFDTTVMASALLSRVIKRPPPRSVARACGTAMRCGYGPLWATVGSLLMKDDARGPSKRSLTLGALSIWSFELIVLPRTGATPALRRWPPPHIALGLTNAVVYSGVAGATLRLLAPRPSRVGMTDSSIREPIPL
ncbi:MAG: hypothetical protein ABR564_03535 [Candidatus Dormibacteria bacterium]